MKILFFTYDFPYPLDSGGKIRAYYLIKGLAKRHQVDLFSFYREEKQLKHLKKIKKFCRQVKLFKRRRLFSPANLGFLSFLPFPAALYYSPQIKKELSRAFQKEKYQFIHFESFYTSIYIDKELNIPQILGTENIEWKVYLDYAKQQPPFIREAMIFEAFRMRRFEEGSWQKADICLAVSDENKQEIERSTKKKCFLVPNGVDFDYFKFNHLTIQSRRKVEDPRHKMSGPSNYPTILFVGNFKYIQNQDAGLVLVKKIFPIIKKEIKSAKILLVGKNPPKKIRNLVTESVILDSQLEDIRDAYFQADVLLAPIRAGSGTKFKILEAMASGVPVVTTKVGSEGIEGQDGQEFIIREKSEDLAKAVIELLENKDLKNKLILKARKLVEEKYSWEKINKELEKVYQSI